MKHTVRTSNCERYAFTTFKSGHPNQRDPFFQTFTYRNARVIDAGRFHAEERSQTIRNRYYIGRTLVISIFALGERKTIRHHRYRPQ